MSPESCPHVSWGMAACPGCGQYCRCCLVCGTCGDCQEKTTPVATGPIAEPLDELRVCPSCLVKRLRVGQGTCDVCLGHPRLARERAEAAEHREPGVTLG